MHKLSNITCNPSLVRSSLGIPCNRTLIINISSRNVSSYLPTSLSSNLCLLQLTQGP